MNDTTILEFVDPTGISPDQLSDILRRGARGLSAQAVETEVCDLMAKHAHLTDAAGRQRLVRHGHLPECEVMMTGIGPVAVKVPQVRDRGKGGWLCCTNSREGFTGKSKMLPVLHEQTHTAEIQNHKLAILYRGLEESRGAFDLV